MTPANADVHDPNSRQDRILSALRCVQEGARSARVGGRLGPTLLGLAVLLAALFLGLAHHDASLLEKAENQGLAGRYADAAATARRVSLAPSQARARLVEAHALELRGNLSAADDAYRRAVAVAPNDWQARRDWALELLRSGHRQRAQTQIARALALNPLMELPLALVAR